MKTNKISKISEDITSSYDSRASLAQNKKKVSNIDVLVSYVNEQCIATIEDLPGFEIVEDSLSEIQAGFSIALEHHLDLMRKAKVLIPDKLNDEYELYFKMNIPSLLSYYGNKFGNTNLANIINATRKQLYDYTIVKRKPRKEQVNRILDNLHELGKELLSLNIHETNDSEQDLLNFYSNKLYKCNIKLSEPNENFKVV